MNSAVAGMPTFYTRLKGLKKGKYIFDLFDEAVGVDFAFVELGEHVVEVGVGLVAELGGR